MPEEAPVTIARLPVRSRVAKARSDYV
jgi:hypothetical protein